MASVGGLGSLLGPMLAVLGRFGPYVGGLGPLLGPMFAVLGPLGTYVGSLRPLLGPMLAVLRPGGESRDALELVLGLLGRSWSQCWRPWGILGAKSGPSPSEEATRQEADKSLKPCKIDKQVT